MTQSAYGFYRSSRSCPSCGGKLLSMTPLNTTFTRGLLHELGVSCFCPQCNNRYRAKGRLRYARLAWMGSAGRWLWWKTCSLQLALKGGEL